MWCSRWWSRCCWQLFLLRCQLWCSTVRCSKSSVLLTTATVRGWCTIASATNWTTRQWTWTALTTTVSSTGTTTRWSAIYSWFVSVDGNARQSATSENSQLGIQCSHQSTESNSTLSSTQPSAAEHLQLAWRIRNREDYIGCLQFYCALGRAQFRSQVHVSLFLYGQSSDDWTRCLSRYIIGFIFISNVISFTKSNGT